jgi:hypothetical protein
MLKKSLKYRFNRQCFELNSAPALRPEGWAAGLGFLGKTPMEGVKKWPYRSTLEIAF